MADKIRRADYFYFEVDDKPGEGAGILGKLKDGGVLLLALGGFPVAGGKAQLTVVPEKTDLFLSTARKAGLTHSARKECFLVEGDDRVGAAHDILARLAEAKINCVASSAVAAGGRFGMVVYVKPADVSATARALGI